MTKGAWPLHFHAEFRHNLEKNLLIPKLKSSHHYNKMSKTIKKYTK